MSEIEIVVPWVPDQACNPNNHKVSERTRIRHRKQGAAAAGYSVRAAYQAHNQRADGYVLFEGPVMLDVTVRWGYRQRSWDSDNLVTALKYLRDVLQHEAIVADDKLIRIGEIRQERATAQPETVLRLRSADAERSAA